MKKELNLTGKIYTIEFLSGMIFYVIGVFLVTPATDPMYVKYLAIGFLVMIQLLIVTILTNWNNVPNTFN